MTQNKQNNTRKPYHSKRKKAMGRKPRNKRSQKLFPDESSGYVQKFIESLGTLPQSSYDSLQQVRDSYLVPLFCKTYANEDDRPPILGGLERDTHGELNGVELFVSCVQMLGYIGDRAGESDFELESLRKETKAQKRQLEDLAELYNLDKENGYKPKYDS